MAKAHEPELALLATSASKRDEIPEAGRQLEKAHEPELSASHLDESREAEQELAKAHEPELSASHLDESREAEQELAKAHEPELSASHLDESREAEQELAKAQETESVVLPVPKCHPDRHEIGEEEQQLAVLRPSAGSDRKQIGEADDQLAKAQYETETGPTVYLDCQQIGEAKTQKETVPVLRPTAESDGEEIEEAERETELARSDHEQVAEIEHQPAKAEEPKLVVAVVASEDARLQWKFVRNIYVLVSIQFVLITAAALIFRGIYVPLLKPCHVLGGRCLANWACIFALLLSPLVVSYALSKFRRKRVVNICILVALTVFNIGSNLAKAQILSDEAVYLPALLTAAALTSLLAFTFWAAHKQYPFTFWPPFLVSSSTVLIVYMVSKIGSLRRTFFACSSTILLCIFLVDDTNKILQKYSRHEYVIAAIPMYMDCLNVIVVLARFLYKKLRRETTVENYMVDLPTLPMLLPL